MQRTRRELSGALSLFGILLALGLLSPVASGVPPAPKGAQTPAPAASAPSLLLVTVDTWRWDYVGAARTGKVETPTIDQLAREGVYEREAVTPCPLTTPAHASMLTGMDPERHGVLDCTRYRLNEAVPTLAEAFRGAGYATAAFVASETLKSRFGLWRGFDLYDDSGMSRRGRADWMPPCRDGSEVTDAFLQALGGLTPGQKAFVWVHYFDLHLPYRPRPAFDKKYPRDNYAAQVAFVDSEIGKLLAALKSDTSRSWRIVVAGDHGEGLGERGEDTHGIGLFRSTLHVPLILFPKPDAPLAQSKPWGLVDLAPTLREWFGLPAAARSDGVSLFKEDRAARALFAASAEPTLLFAVGPSLGVRQGRLFYLRGGEEELYDLQSDAPETHDLSKRAEYRGDLDRLRALCDGNWPAGWLAEARPASLNPSPEDLKNLQSLGYISGSAPAGKKLQRVDIREVMKDKSEWDKAREVAFRTGNSDPLLNLYARLVVKYPTSIAVRNWYGPLLARVGRVTDAIKVLEPAARLYPQDGATLLNMGSIYMSMGQPEKAKTLLDGALEREPENRMIYKELGVLYADYLVNPEKAIGYYKKYLEMGGDIDAQKIKMYIQIQEPYVKKSP